MGRLIPAGTGLDQYRDLEMKITEEEEELPPPVEELPEILAETTALAEQ